MRTAPPHKLCTLMLAACLVSGCSRDAELLKQASVPIRADVFTEIGADSKPAPGLAVLSLRSSWKLPKPGFLSPEHADGESRDQLLVLNIDGQKLTLRGIAREDNERVTGDPEAGAGTRYTFFDTIQLKPGPHRLIVASPSQGIATERAIEVSDRAENYLELRPKYGQAAGGRRIKALSTPTDFHNGMVGFRLVVNGTPIP